MRSIFFSFLVSLVVLSVCGNGETVLAAEKAKLSGIAACNKALKLLTEEKPTEALEIMMGARGTMDADDEWLWWGNVGHCYRDLRKDSDAITFYEKALALKPDCWFRFSFCRLLHEYGRWDEAIVELEKPIDKGYAAQAIALRSVIEGPFKERWPLTYSKLELRSKRGNYLIVSDVGVPEDLMDRIEKRASKLDLSKKVDQGKLKKLLKPSNDLISLANLAELARIQYMKFANLKKSNFPKGKISKVFFMADEDTYHEYASSNGNDDTENALGYYSPYLKYILMYSQPGAETKVCGLSRDTVDTFFHEGWHQTIDMVTQQTPIWMNEGLAEFVGHASVEAKGRSIKLGLLIRERGDNYTRFEVLKIAIKNKIYIPFSKFFHYSYKDWNTGSVGVHYAQAWSVAYYAIKGDNPEFRKAFGKLFRELVKGKNAGEAIKKRFTDKKLKVFERSWLAYWNNL